MDSRTGEAKAEQQAKSGLVDDSRSKPLTPTFYSEMSDIIASIGYEAKKGLPLHTCFRTLVQMCLREMCAYSVRKVL